MGGSVGVGVGGVGGGGWGTGKAGGGGAGCVWGGGEEELEESSNATQDAGKEILNARRGVLNSHGEQGSKQAYTAFLLGWGRRVRGGGLVPTPCKVWAKRSSVHGEGPTLQEVRGRGNLFLF